MGRYILVGVRIDRDRIPEYTPIESFNSAQQAIDVGSTQLDSSRGTHWHVLDNHTGEIVAHGKVAWHDVEP